MNVIYFHLESIQEFIIDYELNGEEVTPFLNSLVEDGNTMYFSNFFHQVAQGKTADAEFMVDNSLYGLPQGSAFMTKGRNTYQSLPGILAQNGGYTSGVFHGNGGGFWNRNEVYKSFGYNNFFDANYYLIKPENQAEYGLMDKPFFEQSIPLLETLEQPFYAKFITVTNHHPYKLDEELATIEKGTTSDSTVNGYFQTARYADEALEQFFQYLEESGLMDNSIIVMYGDHYAISKNRNEAVGEVLNDDEITKVDSADLQRVPLIIRVPGMDGGVNYTYGGQIDVLPTVLHLLGIDTREYIHMGTDLLSEGHSEIVPFRNGDFVSPTIYGIDNKYYDKKTGLEITDEEELSKAKKMEETVKYRLEISDSVVNGDLLRFHTPDGFTPIDRSLYNYTKPKDWSVNTGNESENLNTPSDNEENTNETERNLESEYSIEKIQ
jgi:lipoteichoic acid synthase